MSWKKIVMAYFKKILPSRTEENRGNPVRTTGFRREYLSGSPEYEAEG
jgi:hypothetical protein